MTAAALPVRPGYCSDHLNQRLVSHRVAGVRWFGRPVETVCPGDGHGDDERERCRYCGGPLRRPDEPTWTVSARRVFCTPNHRLRAFRERTKR